MKTSSNGSTAPPTDNMAGSLSITQLRDELVSMPRFERRRVHDAVSRLRSTPEELAPYIQFRREGYTRTRFHEDERFQILVLAWDIGQFSPIHDHNESICSMHVLSGLCESVSFSQPEVGAPLVREQTMTLPAGATTTVYGGDVHLLGCPKHSSERLVTLHFYLPPIDRMLVFNEHTGQSKEVGSTILDVAAG